jgi:hypothetical protein
MDDDDDRTVPVPVPMSAPMPSAVPKSRDLEEGCYYSSGEGAAERQPINPVTLPFQSQLQLQSSLSSSSPLSDENSGRRDDGGWDSSDTGFGEPGAIYFTLDESCEVGNGEAMLTIVECDNY